MTVHFPIVLVILAVAADLIHVVRPRTRGAEVIAALLYLLGALSAVSAYVSGRLAATTVFTPGMAHGLVDDHESWALATMICFVLVAAFRLGIRFTRSANTPGMRMLFLALGLAVLVVVQQTAERGARLVYEQGVGVIRGTFPAGRDLSEPGDPVP
jgi:uncharacterized membrane protein